jgi:hypothetical protein
LQPEELTAAIATTTAATPRLGIAGVCQRAWGKLGAAERFAEAVVVSGWWELPPGT